MLDESFVKDIDFDLLYMLIARINCFGSKVSFILKFVLNSSHLGVAPVMYKFELDVSSGSCLFNNKKVQLSPVSSVAAGWSPR